jgi:hypothetical protein
MRGYLRAVATKSWGSIASAERQETVPSEAIWNKNLGNRRVAANCETPVGEWHSADNWGCHGRIGGELVSAAGMWCMDMMAVGLLPFESSNCATWTIHMDLGEMAYQKNAHTGHRINIQDDNSIQANLNFLN